MPSIVDLEPVLKFYRKTTTTPAVWDQIRVLSHVQTNFPIVDFSYENFAVGGCGASSLTASADLSLTYNDMFEIYVQGALKYTGFIIDVPQEGTNTTWEYQGYGFGQQLDWPIIRTLTYTGKKIDAAVREILANEIAVKTDISSDPSRITIPMLNLGGGWNGVIDNMVFEWRTPSEILRILADLCGDFAFGVDENRKLFFGPKSAALNYRWFVGNAASGIREFTPDETADNLRNYIYVDCGRMSDGDSLYQVYKDDASIKLYGRREEKLSLPDAFPRYSELDRCRNITPTVTGFTAPVGSAASMTDGDGTTYWDSNEPQVGGVSLWSKLDSAADITSPSRGTGGKIIGAPTYAAGKWSNGIVTSAGNYAMFPVEDNGINMERGAISFYWKTDFAAAAGRNVIFADFIDPEKGGYEFGYNASLKKFYIHGVRDVMFNGYLYSPVQTFAAGQLIHLAFTWDNEGKDLPQKLKGSYTNVTAVIFINKVAVAWFTNTWRSCFINPWIYVGVDRTGANYAGGVIDNLKLYDSCQGNFDDDYTTEGANDAEQYIQIDLGAEYQIGKIVLNSEYEDESSYYARGILVQTSVDGVVWKDRFLKDNNSESSLEVIIAPQYWTTSGMKGTRYIRFILRKSDDSYWRIFSIEAYEFQGGDIWQWANQQLKTLKVPEKRAKLVLDGVAVIPVPVGKCTVSDRDGARYEYEISKVSFTASGAVADLDLGPLPITPSERMKWLYRQMLDVEYSINKKASALASGDALKSSAVDHGKINFMLPAQLSGNDLYVRGKVGIGIEPTPTLFPLTIETDGGIMAKGVVGSGLTLPESGAGTRFFWYPRKSALRAGYVGGTEWDDGNIGGSSIALGNNTTASGSCSFAIGYLTTASGDYSVAMGFATSASGLNSTVMGTYTIASAPYSTAMGFISIAAGNYSTAIGHQTTASGHYSVSMGRNTTASGNNTTALGSFLHVSSANSFGVNVSTSLNQITVSRWQTVYLVGGNTVIADQDSLSTEKVTNGTFAADTDWTKGAGWSISGGQAIHTPGGAGGGDLEQDISAVVNEIYLIEFTISNWTVGYVRPQIGGIEGAYAGDNGTYRDMIIPLAAGNLLFHPYTNSFNGRIDNVSVKRIAAGNLHLAKNLLLQGTLDFVSDTATAISGEVLSEYISIKVGGVTKKLALVA